MKTTVPYIGNITRYTMIDEVSSFGGLHCRSECVYMYEWHSPHWQYNECGRKQRCNCSASRIVSI